MRERRPSLEAPAAAVVSSLPLLTKPEPVRLALLADAFDLMAPDGLFVQFTYSLNSPMPRKAAPISFEAEVSPRIWLNVPPARVWVYRRAGEGLGTARARIRGFRYLGASGPSRRDFKAELGEAKSRLRKLAGDLLLPRSDRPLNPAFALLRKIPDLDKLRVYFK